MENRYTSRFRSIGQKSGEQIKNRDAAGNLVEHITHARGSIDAQQKNIQDLFSTAREMITGVNTHQNMMDAELVRNIPIPSAEIEASYSLRLGYVQLTMRFLQAGVLHFMEELVNAQGRIDELESTVATLAKYDNEIDVIGQMKILDLDSPELTGHVVPASVTQPVAAPAKKPDPVRTDSALDTDKQKVKSSTTTPTRRTK